MRRSTSRWRGGCRRRRCFSGSCPSCCSVRTQGPASSPRQSLSKDALGPSNPSSRVSQSQQVKEGVWSSLGALLLGVSPHVNLPASDCQLYFPLCYMFFRLRCTLPAINDTDYKCTANESGQLHTLTCNHDPWNYRTLHFSLIHGTTVPKSVTPDSFLSPPSWQIAVLAFPCLRPSGCKEDCSKVGLGWVASICK